MLQRKLRPGDLEVSELALGTMTFGLQTPEVEAHRILDHARAAGVNFFDTAEMYPAPADAELYGESERIVGRWLDGRGDRDEMVIATKACGPGQFVKWIRNGDSTHTLGNLRAAVEGSLERLKIDCIDLFQLHWPDRAANFFGQLGFKPASNESPFDVEQTLIALQRLVDEGLIRGIGVCNETAWGLHRFLSIAERLDLPLLNSVQNPYNLLNRTLEVGIAEFAERENLPVLAYSPLGFGLLTGKYFASQPDPDSRLNRFKHYKRYQSEQALAAAKRYCTLAAEHQLEPASMAVAWLRSKPFVASVILGASKLAQLEANLEALTVTITPALASAIDQIHREIPNPCP